MSSPIRAASSGLLVPAFLQFNSASARWIASAARAARSASFSCATGYPNSAGQAVAKLLRHVPAHLGHRCGGSIEIGADEVAPFFRVQLCGNAGRADKVAEHHREIAPLASSFRHRSRSRERRSGCVLRG